MPDVTLTIEMHDAKYCQFCGSRLIHDTNAGDPVAECWIECEKMCRGFTWNEERKERYWKRHIEQVAKLTKRCEDLEKQLEAAKKVAA